MKAKDFNYHGLRLLQLCSKITCCGTEAYQRVGINKVKSFSFTFFRLEDNSIIRTITVYDFEEELMSRFHAYENIINRLISGDMSVILKKHERKIIHQEGTKANSKSSES